MISSGNAMTLQSLEPTADDMLHRDSASAKDGFSFVDHISRFSGLAVAQLYLICAADRKSVV